MLEPLYDKLAKEYYDEFHKTSRNFDAATIEALKEIKAKVPSDGLVLDVGAGKGRAIEFLGVESQRIVQLDSSRKMLEIEPREKCLIRILHPAEELPFFDAQFSCVAAFLCDPFLGLNFLSEVFRVLRPEGMFIATNPSFEWASLLRPAISISINETRFVMKDGNVLRIPSTVAQSAGLEAMMTRSGFSLKKTDITQHCLPASAKVVSPDIEKPAKQSGHDAYSLPILTRIIAVK